MGKLLSNFRTTFLLSIVLAGVMILSFGRIAPGGFDTSFWQAVLRWVHVVAGILWIGLLYYFNFVQIRVMPSIPAVSEYRSPIALSSSTRTRCNSLCGAAANVSPAPNRPWSRM